MPKIVIKEIDNTTTGVSTGTNFSVVVPGFIKSGISSDTTYQYGYDEDGNSVFDENGIYECSSQSDFEKYIGKVSATGLNAVAPTVFLQSNELSAHDFYVTYDGLVYTRAEDTSGAYTESGYLREVESDDNVYIYTKATEWVAGTAYYIIQEGKEGQDASETGYQHGNQIAYLLLGIGYTVLYMKLDTLEDLTKEDKWNVLKDKSIYDFRYMISGLLQDQDGVTVDLVNKRMSDVAYNDADTYTDTEGRGDCIALLDIAQTAYTENGVGLNQAKAVNNIKTIVQNAGIVHPYAAYFAPSVVYSDIDDDEYNNNNILPASVHYLFCAANAFSRYAEWYAVSGYTRGISDFTIKSTKVKLGDAAVNALQKRKNEDGIAAVNLIVNLNGDYYIWGNRTSYYSEDHDDGLIASNFLNIRQLCCTLKKQIYTTCRQLMFDPNSDILWLNFCNAIRPTLDAMKANQGIKDYRFEKKDTSLKAKLFAAIRIVPIEAVEDFEIGVTLEDSLDDTTITIKELLTE